MSAVVAFVFVGFSSSGTTPFGKNSVERYNNCERR